MLFFSVSTGNLILKRAWMTRKLSLISVSLKRDVSLKIQLEYGTWINRFRMLPNWAALTPYKALVVVMATLVLHNLLRLKWRHGYTPKGSVDEIQSNGSLLQSNCVKIVRQTS